MVMLKVPVRADGSGPLIDWSFYNRIRVLFSPGITPHLPLDYLGGVTVTKFSAGILFPLYSYIRLARPQIYLAIP